MHLSISNTFGYLKGGYAIGSKKMAQETIIETQINDPSENLHNALIHCKNCKHIVPKTIICLYCGAKI
jgi:hypothetical protein